MSEQITFFIRAINTKCLGFITHMEVCSNIRHPEACMRETKYGNTRQDVLAVASANCVAECINRAAQIFGGFLPQTSIIEFDPSRDSIPIFGSLRHHFITTRELRGRSLQSGQG